MSRMADSRRDALHQVPVRVRHRLARLHQARLAREVAEEQPEALSAVGAGRLYLEHRLVVDEDPRAPGLGDLAPGLGDLEVGELSGITLRGDEADHAGQPLRRQEPALPAAHQAVVHLERLVEDAAVGGLRRAPDDAHEVDLVDQRVQHVGADRGVHAAAQRPHHDAAGKDHLRFQPAIERKAAHEVGRARDHGAKARVVVALRHLGVERLEHGQELGRRILGEGAMRVLQARQDIDLVGHGEQRRGRLAGADAAGQHALDIAARVELDQGGHDRRVDDAAPAEEAAALDEGLDVDRQAGIVRRRRLEAAEVRGGTDDVVVALTGRHDPVACSIDVHGVRQDLRAVLDLVLEQGVGRAELRRHRRQGRKPLPLWTRSPEPCRW